MEEVHKYPNAAGRRLRNQCINTTIVGITRRNRLAMTERPAHHQFCLIAQKWRNLAEQRRVHFADLYHSGRWRRYYTEEEFLVRMRDVAHLCERWGQIVDAAQTQIEAPPAGPDPILHRDAA